VEIIIAIVVLVVLAAVGLFAASRRTDASSAINEVSAETLRKDRARVKSAVGAAAAEGGLTGRDVEKSVALERRQGDLAVPEAEVEPWVAPDPEVIGVARRQFLNRAIIGVFGLNLGGFGLAVIAQLWPGASEGFGAPIPVGPLTDVVASIRANNGFLYLPEGKMYVTEYPAGSLEKAAPIYAATPAWPGIEAGVKAVFQKCPHLGCRVPECGSSQFFEF